MKQDSVPVRTNILFVCLGNICRSPMAEGLMRHMVKQSGLHDRIALDSAGLGSWHIGHPPDERAVETLSIRGVEISDLRARQISVDDFEKFDLILAMDRSNRQALAKLAPKDLGHKVHLLMEYAPNLGVHEIPDPYFGGRKGFDYVAQLIETACRGVLHNFVAKPHLNPTSRNTSSLKEE
ncbi:MAG: low molecular weight phosphotyrosine protein phosphatase [Alphaproteobacteria bacterium]